MKSQPIRNQDYKRWRAHAFCRYRRCHGYFTRVIVSFWRRCVFFRLYLLAQVSKQQESFLSTIRRLVLKNSFTPPCFPTRFQWELGTEKLKMFVHKFHPQKRYGSVSVQRLFSTIHCTNCKYTKRFVCKIEPLFQNALSPAKRKFIQTLSSLPVPSLELVSSSPSHAYY